MKDRYQEMHDAEVFTPNTVFELAGYIDTLVNQEHDYNTCPYAMSMAAVAAFNFVAHKLGVTGFQASCADLDILRRLRRLECFSIVDMGNLLYPQYADSFPGYEQLLVKHADWLKKKAQEKLSHEGNSNARPDVLAHWKKLAGAE